MAAPGVARHPPDSMTDIRIEIEGHVPSLLAHLIDVVLGQAVQRLWSTSPRRRESHARGYRVGPRARAGRLAWIGLMIPTPFASSSPNEEPGEISGLCPAVSIRRRSAAGFTGSAMPSSVFSINSNISALSPHAMTSATTTISLPSSSRQCEYGSDLMSRWPSSGPTPFQFFFDDLKIWREPQRNLSLFPFYSSKKSQEYASSERSQRDGVSPTSWNRR